MKVLEIILDAALIVCNIALIVLLLKGEKDES